MSGSADLHKAIAALWLSSGLDTLLKSYWASADRELFPSLNDKDAAPGTPLPYVVYEAGEPGVDARMSSTGRRKLLISGHTWVFGLFAGQTDDYSAKELARLLGEEVLKVFGGHPTETPTAIDMELDNGHVLNVQYQFDHLERQSDEVHKWLGSYQIKTDVPIMV